MNWRKTIVTVIVVVILFVVVYMITGMLSGMAEAPEEKQKEAIKLYVKTEIATTTEIHPEATYRGRVASLGNVVLSAEVSGMILPGDVPLKEGQSFHKGDVLVSIYDEDKKASLQSLQRWKWSPTKHLPRKCRRRTRQASPSQGPRPRTFPRRR